LELRLRGGTAIRAITTFDRGNRHRIAGKKTIGSRIMTRSHSFGKAPNTCKREVVFIADYLSSRLDPQEQAVFESHLKACSDCAAFLQTYKKTIELTRTFLLSPRLQGTCQSLLPPTPGQSTRR
jgi:Putative zinc-finger